MRYNILAIVFLAICPILVAQQALNNDSVIKLVKAGLTDDLIVSTVLGSAGVYDTSADGIIALKTAGVSDKVIAAVVGRANASAIAATAPASPVAAQVSSVQPSETHTPPPPFHSMDGKIRLYVTDHPMFESNGLAAASGDRHGGSAAAVSHTQAGDDPRTVEIQADILKVCPAYIMASNNQDRADYVLVFRRRGGERSSMFAMGGLSGLALSAAAKVNNASLFDISGDMIYATKQTSVEKAVRDICAHIPAPSTAAVLAPIPPPPPPSN